MRVAVCDDDSRTLAQMKRFLDRFGKENGMEMLTSFYESGEEFLREYSDELDILFLDIRMYQMSGMDVARYIRRFDEELCIIFISNMTQYALEGYQVHAFNFIVKPFDYKIFEREMTLACKKVRMKKNDSLTVKNDSGVFQIRLSELVYAETLDHKLLLHTRQKKIICHISMGQLEKQLETKEFFRCHQSFLVNLARVEEVRRMSVLMTDGSDIPLSRHRRRELIQAMAKYAGEML